MKTAFTAAILAVSALSLAACGGKGDDKLGDQVEQAADNNAAALEATADNLEDRAEAIRDNGEERSEAIDDADVNADALTNGQKAAVINGSAEVK
jgi:predicted small lipoprotein YifL